eukprot:TRINITY_DN17499_c0_g1_i1.p1 TRINITY_DN17499_c0_g1~~TRINITY_DN17499_c0_g1_i1.p1  ORF type:complete len:127 (+),score=16.84 TRINITY_DN17499_c0_g1_i1:118-498(+)
MSLATLLCQCVSSVCMVVSFLHVAVRLLYANSFQHGSLKHDSHRRVHHVEDSDAETTSTCSGSESSAPDSLGHLRLSSEDSERKSCGDHQDNQPAFDIVVGDGWTDVGDRLALLFRRLDIDDDQHD